MVDEMVNNIEFKPIAVGTVISVVLILLLPMGMMHCFWVMLGSAISGYMTNNSTKYALVYGTIIGLISSFFMLTVFTIPLYMILGIFGAFVGKVVQANLTN